MRGSLRAGIARDHAEAVHHADRRRLDLPGFGAARRRPCSTRRSSSPITTIASWSRSSSRRSASRRRSSSSRRAAIPARPSRSPPRSRASARPETVVAVFAADHVVADQQAFLALCAAAAEAAATGLYRHARRQADRAGDRLRLYPSRRGHRGDGARRVDAFVEKPDRETAERYVADGYLWNSGNFFFRADVMLEELRAFEPEMAEAAAAALAKAPSATSASSRSTREAFGDAPKKSIDYAVMERTKRAAVVPADIGWSDVGNWDAVWKLSPARRATATPSMARASRSTPKNVHVRSNGLLTAVVGVKDVIVVTTQDAVLVLARDQGDKVKAARRRAASAASAARRPSTSACTAPGAITSRSTTGAALPGQAHRRHARPPAVAAEALSPRRALDRGQGHGGGHARRRSHDGARERVDLSCRSASSTGSPIPARSIWS